MIDLAAYRTTGSIAVGSELFGAVCDSSRMYVSATATSRVLVFEHPPLRQVAVIPTEELPRGLALIDRSLYVTHFSSGRLSVIDSSSFIVQRVIGTGFDSNLSQAAWIEGSRVYLPQTRSNSSNQALLFDTTVFPIVSVVDLNSGQNLPRDRIAIDIADRPSNSNVRSRAGLTGGTRTCMCMICLTPLMRTTIEITNEQRAKLLELAARRGEKGFSRLVQEAVDGYLQGIEQRDEAVRRALAMLGTLSEKSARRMRSSIETLRSHWR